jgi:hypothetical protein
MQIVYFAFIVLKIKNSKQNLNVSKTEIDFDPPQNEWMKSKDIAEKIHESKKKLLTEGIIN